nr:nuclear-pore anchor isoform X2 [Ipomoea batatas]
MHRRSSGRHSCRHNSRAWTNQLLGSTNLPQGKWSRNFWKNLKHLVSILKHEKEILVRSEKRASDEVRSLSERVHRLQASLDTIQSTEEVREVGNCKIMKVTFTFCYGRRLGVLRGESNNVRNLTLVRENDLKSALRQVEEMGKELANSLHSLSMVESRAAVAEARAAGLEEKLQSSHTKISDIDGGSGPSSSSSEYKSIAQANEEALKQMEQAHENFKVEADNMKNSLEEEILLLRKRAKKLEEKGFFSGAGCSYVDVRDVANAHIQYLRPVEDTVWLVKQYTLLRYKGEDLPVAPTFKVSQEKAKSLGINFTSFAVTLKDTIESLKEKNFLSF